MWQPCHSSMARVPVRGSYAWFFPCCISRIRQRACSKLTAHQIIKWPPSSQPAWQPSIVLITFQSFKRTHGTPQLGCVSFVTGAPVGTAQSPLLSACPPVPAWCKHWWGHQFLEGTRQEFWASAASPSAASPGPQSPTARRQSCSSQPGSAKLELVKEWKHQLMSAMTTKMVKMAFPGFWNPKSNCK